MYQTYKGGIAICFIVCYCLHVANGNVTDNDTDNGTDNGSGSGDVVVLHNYYTETKYKKNMLQEEAREERARYKL